MTIQYLYESQVAFKHVTDGIYCVEKDRVDAYGRGKFVSTNDVIEALNSDRKVTLSNNHSVHLASNFELESVLRRIERSDQ